MIGKNVGLSNAILNARSGSIVIGDNTIFGHNVMVLTGVHDYASPSMPTLTEASRDITIGQSVWVASGAIVIGPVSIGSNSVIGAGSVVTKDIPERVFAAGNPARVIKELKIR